MLADKLRAAIRVPPKPVEYVGASFTNGTIFTMPTGRQAGDLLVAVLGTTGSAYTSSVVPSTAPAGWTNVSRSYFVANTPMGYGYFEVYWRIATGDSSDALSISYMDFGLVCAYRNAGSVVVAACDRSVSIPTPASRSSAALLADENGAARLFCAVNTPPVNLGSISGSTTVVNHIQPNNYSFNAWTEGNLQKGLMPVVTKTGTSSSDDTAGSAAITVAIQPDILRTSVQTVAHQTTQNTASGTSLVIAKPTSQSGDLLVAFLAANGTTSFSAPSGWTVASSGSHGAIAYKTDGGSEPTDYTFTAGSSRLLAGTIVSFRNCVFDSSTSFRTSAAGSQAVYPVPTSSANNNLMVGFLYQTAATTTHQSVFGLETVVFQDSSGTAPCYNIVSGTIGYPGSEYTDFKSTKASYAATAYTAAVSLKPI